MPQWSYCSLLEGWLLVSLGHHLPDIWAASHVISYTNETRAVAALAGTRKKRAKNISIAMTHHFTPVAIETLGMFEQ